MRAMASGRLCPSVEEIASYVGGRLARNRFDDLEAHLDVCNDCARVVVEAAGTSSSGADPQRHHPRIFQPEQLIAGRYEIVAFLGAGGMGEVYEARDQELGDRIALKTVSAAISLDVAAVARFKAEAQLARKVTHRNVCRVFDLGIHVEKAAGGEAPALTPFLTMELIRGRALSDHIRAGQRFNDDEARAVARQIARGLEAAHEAGVLHRDLKSDNVLLLPAPRDHFRVVLTDFGLAAASIVEDASDPGPSKGTSLCGTRAYLAPERLAGARATVASDVYALGVVIYELVTGALVDAIAEARFEALSPSAPMASVIRACLAPEPGQRPANVAAVLKGLDDDLERPALVANPDSSPRRRERTRRRLWWWALGPAVACAIMASLLIQGGAARSRAGSASVTSATPLTSHRAPFPPPPEPAVAAAAGPPAVPVSSLPASAPRRLGQRPARGERASGEVARRSRLESAEQRLRSGNIEQACVLGRQAADRAPESPAVWEFLGRCFMRLGEPQEARQHYKRYLALAPGGSNELFVKAMIDEDEQ